MTRAIILGCLASGGLVVLSYRVGHAAGRIQARLAQAVEAPEDHSGCQAIIGTLSSAIRSQQAYIDALEQASDLGDQAEQFLREAGG